MWTSRPSSASLDLRCLVALFVQDCAAAHIGMTTRKPDFEAINLSCSFEGIGSLSRRLRLTLGGCFRDPFGVWICMIFLLVTAYFELCSVLVQGHGMSEVAWFVPRRAAQWQFSGDETDAGDTIKHSNEVDIDIHAESSLEVGTHVPSFLSIVFVEFVGERYLSSIVRWEKSDLVEHASQATSSVCTSRETEETDVVAFAVGLHKEAVGISHVDTEATTDCHVNSSSDAIAQSSGILTRCTMLLLSPSNLSPVPSRQMIRVRPFVVVPFSVAWMYLGN
ncbi:hypothetical protein KCV07_g321, partial [Aureobasidium melanogenum]